MAKGKEFLSSTGENSEYLIEAELLFFLPRWYI